VSGREPVTGAAKGCPDWRALARERAARPGDPAGWDAALAHLDDCARCRRDAPAADPLLVFRRLPPVQVDGGEVEAMRLRVAALVRASEVGKPQGRLPAALGSRRLQRAGQGAAAAAVLALALFTAPHAPTTDALASVAAVAPPRLADELAAQPLLEEMDQPYDNVVQWDAADLSVVLVLDQRFAASAGG
jgi:hypothetical protein